MLLHIKESSIFSRKHIFPTRWPVLGTLLQYFTTTNVSKAEQATVANRLSSITEFFTETEYEEAKVSDTGQL